MLSKVYRLSVASGERQNDRIGDEGPQSADCNSYVMNFLQTLNQACLALGQLQRSFSNNMPRIRNLGQIDNWGNLTLASR